MSAVDKANKFIRTAKEHGWDTKYRILDPDDPVIEVTATRGPEKLVLEWAGNQLALSPAYSLHDMQRKLHHVKQALQKVTAYKPDMAAYAKWQNGKKGEKTPVEIDVSDYTLPFDIHESQDSEILKAIRGNTIVYRQEMTGTIESTFVPWRTSDGKTFNWDLNNVFYIAVGETTDRAYVSFMDSNGQFRAVHLDRLVGVV